MSFILDALKKSESDRQRQSGPSLFEVKVAPPRRALPIWAVAIAALLGINAIVVSWMLLRRGPAAPPAAAAAPAAAASPAAAPAAAPAPDAAASTARARTSGTMAQTPVAAESAPAAAAVAPLASPAARSAGAPPAAAPLAGSGDESAGDESAGQAPPADNPSDYAPAVEPASAPGSGAADDGEAGVLPLYQQIATSANLPALHLDLHVFAARPQDRFVMINMEKLEEGGSLPNGVRVEAIRPDGVVLSYHGTRFLLPRS